ASAVYYVLGDVSAPGHYPFLGRETALDAILAAGGLSARGSRCDIILSRPSPPGECRTVLPICYDHIVQLGDTSTNYQIAPGDRIYVASRSCWHDLLPGWLRPRCALCGGCDGCGPEACGGAAVVHAPPVSYAVPHGLQGGAPPAASGMPPSGVEMIPPAPADEARWTPVTPGRDARIQ
ncbi:MAG TPA: SLBB domain-containing protein, partial [Planctomycetaceae bacterium]|nr:SLBB domain-containing protein [Planctomycetaceae bacterium]